MVACFQVLQQDRELQELLDVLIVLLVPAIDQDLQAAVDHFELFGGVFVHNSDYLRAFERTSLAFNALTNLFGSGYSYR